MNLIVGLGNPGKEYEDSRHNLGWRWLEWWRANSGFEYSPWKKSAKLMGEISQSADKKILLLKPQTFMNKSGHSVVAVVKFYKLKPENLIVAHDDLDLPAGAFKIQTNRGAAGHHGVESIIAALGTKNFTRLRLGIRPRPFAPPKGRGKPLAETKLDKDFVLGRFGKAESALVSGALKPASDALSSYAHLADN